MRVPGKTEEARRILREAEERAKREYTQPCMLATAATFAGEWEKGLAYIERAESERDTLFVVLARWWPEYDSMRKDARFNAIVDRLRLPGGRSA